MCAHASGQMALFYIPSLPFKNAPIIHAMRQLSQQYPRYGFRRIRVLLKCEGIETGGDRCHRLWAEQGLKVPKKLSRKRVAESPPRPMVPAIANGGCGVATLCSMRASMVSNTSA